MSKLLYLLDSTATESLGVKGSVLLGISYFVFYCYTLTILMCVTTSILTLFSSSLSLRFVSQLLTTLGVHTYKLPKSTNVFLRNIILYFISECKFLCKLHALDKTKVCEGD